MNTTEGTPNKRQLAGARADRLFWFLGWIYDFSKYATIVLLLGLVVHYFFFTLLVVRGKSMEPNFADGQVLAVNKIAYRSATPQRGDVIAMYFPGETEKRFIKRIVALPNESIAVDNGQVFIDGTILAEEYLPKDLSTLPDLQRTLESNEYFVLGDNRLNSSDSRAWGPVPRSYIIGKVGGQLFRLSSN